MSCVVVVVVTAKVHMATTTTPIDGGVSNTDQEAVWVDDSSALKKREVPSPKLPLATTYTHLLCVLTTSV